jgi:hypothetical protein
MRIVVIAALYNLPTRGRGSAAALQSALILKFAGSS